MDANLTLRGEADVRELARDVLSRLAPADRAAVVALSGELGAGKTALARAICRELGVGVAVQSPTFPICRRYEAAPGAKFAAIFHFDWYRLSGEADLAAVGWDEALSTPGALAIVEWPERAPGAIPEAALRISLAHGDAPGERVATVSGGAPAGLAE